MLDNCLPLDLPLGRPTFCWGDFATASNQSEFVTMFSNFREKFFEFFGTEGKSLFGVDGQTTGSCAFFGEVIHSFEFFFNFFFGFMYCDTGHVISV